MVSAKTGFGVVRGLVGFGFQIRQLSPYGYVYVLSGRFTFRSNESVTHSGYGRSDLGVVPYAAYLHSKSFDSSQELSRPRTQTYVVQPLTDY